MVAGALLNLSNIVISSQSGSYSVLFQELLLNYRNDLYYLVDSNLKLTNEIPQDRVVYICAEEKLKNLSTVENSIRQLSHLGMTKKSELVVIGGGFLQDIGTLVASLYMRGVVWTFVPTTLAAMGDSCVGGKSSINAGDVKNLVGNFYPPSKIVIDVNFVASLPPIEIVAGLSEILKICFAHSQQSFEQFLQLLNMEEKDLKIKNSSEIVQLSILSKKYFIEEDEFDTGIRKKLNFGHSFGHALESATEYKVPHGVAVLFGILAACQHPAAFRNRNTELLCEISLALLNKVRREVIPALQQVDLHKFELSISKDKKNTDADLVLILPGEKDLDIVPLPFKEDSVQVASAAIKTVIERFLIEVR